VDWRCDYDYNARNEIVAVTEFSPLLGEIVTVVYDYDKRGRLVQETRTRGLSGDPEVVYDITYKYDDGGNRREKFNSVSQRRTVYHYDIDDPGVYGSNNNRLMYYEEFDTAPDPDELLSTTRYYHRPNGNVHRVVTQDENRLPSDPDDTPLSPDRFKPAPHRAPHKCSS